MKKIDHMTLEQLEREVWPEPEGQAYALVTTCHRLRKKKLGDFSVEDLRVMIGQGIGVPYLLPMAVALLRENPFTEGDFFKGDLLMAAVKLPPEAWAKDKQLRRDVKTACKAVLASGNPVLPKADRVLVEAFLGK